MPRVPDDTDASPSELSLGPFRALRYAAGIALERVLAPPYDVVERDEALSLALADEHNIVRLILPDGPLAAADTLRDWVDDGVLLRDPARAVYAYEQADAEGRVLQRGLIGALGLGSAAVLPHEDVMLDLVEDRARLMAATSSNLEPIWLLFRGEGGVATQLIEDVCQGAALAEARTGDGLRHRLWSVTDPEQLTRLRADLAGRQALIADGHHRYAAYGRVQARQHALGLGAGAWDRGLALLVDLQAHSPTLAAIHRHVSGPSPVVAGRLAEDLLGFEVETINGQWRDHPPAHGSLLLVGADETLTMLHVRDRALVDQALRGALADSPEAGKPQLWRSMDTVALHHLLLPLWGVPEPDISYHHDPAHAVALARSRGGLAVLLAPVEVDVVFTLAEQGVRMPRKSTSFGPKPRSGLLIRTLDDGP
jgi:uncharacterized protein (DUF1015 family)